MTAVTGVQQDAFDARRFVANVLAVARRRWLLMAVVFVAALIGGLYVVFTRTRIYRAEAFLLVAQPTTPGWVGATEVPVVADVLAATRARSVATHLAAIKSPAVLGRAYDRLPQKFREVFGPPGFSTLERLPVSASAPEEADVLRVSVTSSDPEAAAALANAVAREHIEYTRDFNRGLARSALNYVDADLEDARYKVDEAEEALLAEKRRTRLFNPEQQISAKAAAAAEAERKADEAAVEHQAALAQLARLKAAIAQEPAMQTSTTKEDRNPVVDELKSSISELKIRRAETAARFSPSSPEVREIDSQIAAAKEALSSEAARLKTEEDKAINAVREALRQEAARLQATAQAAAARERENRRLYERYMRELERLNAAQATLLKLTTTAEVLRENYRLLRQRRQNLAMGAQARLPDVSVLSLAEVPSRPIGPRKRVQVLFVLFVSGLLACVAAWLAELFSPQPRTPG